MKLGIKFYKNDFLFVSNCLKKILCHYSIHSFLNRIVTKIEEEEDDDDMPLAKVKLKNDKKNANCVIKKEEKELVPQLNFMLDPAELRVAVESLHLEPDNEAK